MIKVLAPTGIFRKDSETMTIRWNDGGISDFSLRFLRLSCPCAVCVNEWTGERMLDPSRIPVNSKPTRIFSVGKYAVAIHWSDGHNTGIYSYEYLKKLASEPESLPK
jgi:ATP-binding protein involved in chromosome partitioning